MKTRAAEIRTNGRPPKQGSDPAQCVARRGLERSDHRRRGRTPCDKFIDTHSIKAIVARNSRAARNRIKTR